jgi:hypothetical protein
MLGQLRWSLFYIVWQRVLSFLGRCSTTWTMLLVLIALVIFEEGCCFMPKSCHLHISLSRNDRHILWHPAIGWDGILQTFCLWPWTMILPISTSWVARITRLSHYIWLYIHFWRIYLLDVQLLVGRFFAFITLQCFSIACDLQIIW